MDFNCAQLNHCSFFKNFFRFFLPLILLYWNSISHAGQTCTPYWTEHYKQSMDYLELEMVLHWHCIYYPDPISPPSPPSPPTPPAPPPRTAEQIERDAHVQFCRTYGQKINWAENQCKGQGLGYHNNYVYNNCSNSFQRSYTVSFGSPLLNVGLNAEPDPALSCSAFAERNLNIWRQDCETSASAYRYALSLNCADVN